MAIDAEVISKINAIKARSEQLYSTSEVEQAIGLVGQKMQAELADKNPILLAVMKGAVVFFGKLATYCDFPLQLDYIHATRYKDNTSGGQLDWLVTPSISLKNRHVVIVDDILDEGITLKAIVEYCEQQGASKVYTSVLVDKNRKRAVNGLARADFTALTIENRYLFGYGMDYQGYLRNVAAICAIDPKDM